MMGDCRIWRKELEEAYGGVPLSAGAHAHISACGECGERRRRGESLARLLGGLERVAAPPDFEFRLRAGLAARRAGGARSLFPRYAFAFAAACVALLSLAAYLRAPHAGPPPALNAAAEAGPQVTVPPGRDDIKHDHEVGAVAVAAGGGQPAASAAASASPGAGRGHSADTVSRPRAAPERLVAGGAANRHSAHVFNVRSAVVRDASDAVAGTTFSSAPPVAIRVSAGEEPLRVLLRDERGGARVVPLRTVSFGAQEIVARQKGAPRPSPVEQEGVW